ncbi:MAG: hypothetical protein JWM68_293 [Verrucomicrobiales bacterium]|nr:hypothetical protein [Verrucomicrobiales bacterium]
MSIYTLLGFVVLALGVVAARFLERAFKDGRLSRIWIFAEVGILVVGIVLGILAVAHSRFPTPDTRLLGFPFLAAVFERSPTGGWADFVGVRTLLATLGNFIVGLFLPHLLFAGVAWFSTRKHNAA